MTNIIFEDAWQRNDSRFSNDAKAFWTAMGLSVEKRESRALELVALAYADGELVAVSTAALHYAPMLGARMAFYRCAVAPEFRRRALSYRLSGHARSLLESWSLQHPEEKIMGMAAVMQAAEYQDRLCEPFWPEHGLHLNFACYTPKGQQLRVAWFEHARIGIEQDERM